MERHYFWNRIPIAMIFHTESIEYLISLMIAAQRIVFDTCNRRFFVDIKCIRSSEMYTECKCIFKPTLVNNILVKWFGFRFNAVAFRHWMWCQELWHCEMSLTIHLAHWIMLPVWFSTHLNKSKMKISNRIHCIVDEASSEVH